MNVGSMLSYGGMTLCALVGLKLIAYIAHSIQTLVQERTRFKLASELLKSRIVSAKRSLIFPDEETLPWSGIRKFRIKWKVAECVDASSFYLVPHDGKRLPPFKPGQYLTLSAKLDARSIVRCYSLSDSPRQDYYRITVKKIRGTGSNEPGKFSSYLNDELKEGDIVDVKAPRGSFFLDCESNRPVVLLAAGIGVTPIVSMLNYIVQTNSTRQVYLFMGARDGANHPFKKQLSTVANEFSNVHLVTCYSAPREDDKHGVDFDRVGRVGVDLLRETLPSSNFEYYLCGPPAFIDSLTSGLKEWGVPNDDVKLEAFGPASRKSAKEEKASSSSASSTGLKVQFARSGKSAVWDGKYETLLDLAEANQIQIDSGCRAGNCGTCLIAVKSGRIQHQSDPGSEVDEGTCLPCIAVPDENVILDT